MRQNSVEGGPGGSIKKKAKTSPKEKNFGKKKKTSGVAVANVENQGGPLTEERKVPVLFRLKGGGKVTKRGGQQHY